MDEREDITQQHDQPQSQEPTTEGYPEEQPDGGAGESGGGRDRSGAKPKDDEDSKGGAATGNPHAAG